MGKALERREVSGFADAVGGMMGDGVDDGGEEDDDDDEERLVLDFEPFWDGGGTRGDTESVTSCWRNSLVCSRMGST